MLKATKSILFTASLHGLLAGSLLVPSESWASCGKFLIAKGDIQVDVLKTKKNEKAKAGMEVCSGDTVSAGVDSRAKIAMAGGDELNISPESKLTIEQMDQNADKNEKKVLLNVLYGKVRSSLKQKYDDKSADGQTNTYQVKTKSAVAGVRGTDFLMGYSQTSQKSEVVTFSGKVDVGQAGPGGRIMNAVSVGAGQKTEASAGAPPAPPKPVPASELKQLNNETKADTAGNQDKNAAGNNARSDEKDKDKDKEKDKKEDNKEAKREDSKKDSDSKKDDGNKEAKRDDAKSDGKKDDQGKREDRRNDRAGNDRTGDDSSAKKDDGGNSKRADDGGTRRNGDDGNARRNNEDGGARRNDDGSGKRAGGDAAGGPRGGDTAGGPRGGSDSTTGGMRGGGPDSGTAKAPPSGGMTGGGGFSPGGAAPGGGLPPMGGPGGPPGMGGGDFGRMPGSIGGGMPSMPSMIDGADLGVMPGGVRLPDLSSNPATTLPNLNILPPSLPPPPPKCDFCDRAIQTGPARVHITINVTN